MKKNYNAFTLAEILITLGIIGVVAALTLPVISENVQNIVLKNQFKKAYSVFSQAVFQAQSQLDMPVACFYWLNGGICEEVCSQKDPVYNTCTAWECSDGVNCRLIKPVCDTTVRPFKMNYLIKY